jgi:predicted Zn-dependent peptidase
LRRATLANGLRVVTVHRGQSPLVALKLLIKVGSRHDGDRPGISHVVEHVLFNREWDSGESPFDRIEGTGGDLNAVTHREYTALQAVVLGEYVPDVLRAFGAVLAPLEVSEEQLSGERDVILHEIEAAADSQTVLWDLFLQGMWNGDPLARPIYGYPETVRALSVADLEAHFARYLVPSRMVLAAAGSLDHDEIVRLAERHLGWARADVWQDTFPPPGRGSGQAALEKQLQATHLALGVEAAGMRDRRRPSVKLLHILLGSGATSRLHRRLRVSRSLVYHASTLAMAYEDRGYLCAYTTCSPHRVREVIEAVIEEFDRLRREPVAHEELADAKLRYEGSLARHFETALSVASLVAIEELIDRFEPFEESIAAVRHVTPENLQAVAEEVFALDRLVLARVGRAVTAAGAAGG